MDPAHLPGVIQETRGFNVIFIHSDLDDAGLSPAEFRVYSHLSRRASSGAAWPSVRSIAGVCRLNKDTVCEALNVLEARGMLRRERRGFSSTIYFLSPRSDWLSEIEGQAALSESRGQGVRIEGTAPVRKEGTEGDPVEGNPQKVIHSTQELPVVAAAGRARGEREEWRRKRVPSVDEAKRIAVMFDRALTKPWDEAEIVAFRNLCPFDQEELRMIERFYLANWSVADNPHRCRRTVLALLQNWSGELDKAKGWSRSHPEKKKRAPAADLPTEPPGFRVWLRAEYPKADPRHPWEELPADITAKYFASIKGEGTVTFRDTVP